MGGLDWLLAPLRAGKRIPKPVLLATAASLAAVGGAFGIALAVVEWRDEEGDSTAAGRRIDDVDASLAELSDQVDQIEERLNKLTLAPSPTPTPTAPPALTPTPAPTPTPTPEPGSSRDNPVPLGQPLLLQGWEVTVVDWCCGPTEGRAASVVAVRLRAVNVSAGELASLDSLSFSMVLSTGAVQECYRSNTSDLVRRGVQGATLEGNISCSTPPDETGPFLIGGRFFALE